MGLMDFFKKKKTYDADGFDKEGYNRLGYDRMGYNREGYDINGYDRNGYNSKGIYKLTGRDAEGYDADGYDKDGRNRQGYDKDGYNQEGYDKEGYNRLGINKDGFNREGYDADGFDKEGFDRNGFNKSGYDRDGYNKSGFDRNGLDREGFNKKGYDIEGYDRDGYDKRGYDKSGYNRDGYDKKGYDRNGFDIDGFNSDGIDINGFNVEGYDKDGYDKEGYNIMGFNREGISKLGYKKEDFDEAGYHKITGLDVFGYSRYGFNVNGINKHTGRDRLGFNSDGIDEKGFNIWGFNIELQTDRLGNPIAIYENDPNMSEEKCNEFETMYYQYMGGKFSIAIKLANCYCYGIGTIKDFKRALRILVDVAFEYQDIDALRELADHFYIGDIIGQNISLSNYLNDIVDSKKILSINQYKARQALEFQKPLNTGNKIFAEEEKHLEKVMRSLNRQIRKSESRICDIDNDTSWMDRDQLDDWREKKARKLEEGAKIERFERVKSRPYYARMDAKTSSGKESFYIGEESYSDYEDPSCSVFSVWSEIGKRYRDSTHTSFSVNDHSYEVLLRRKIDIVDGELSGYYDEYTEGSDAAKADITNPYLLRILEAKRGEKNITNIIRSIQLNQNEIIEADFAENIIVQGCAGSGKTMILLHRLANMKYNKSNYDWSRVKIITPNKDFTLFIDELSRNLKIDEIEKLTLQEYYLQLLKKYAVQNPERITRNGETSIVNTFNLVNEQKKLRDENELDRDIRELVYSESFRKELEKIVKHNKSDINSYRDANDLFVKSFQSIIEGQGLKVGKRVPNYMCYLYGKVLFMYLIFGAINSNEKMLCIDEGQDISELQYVLLYEVNGKKTCLNIYGDLAQRIPENINISSWDRLVEILDASYYELNENYRNSENIINFYGKRLGIKNGSFGLQTKDVEQFGDEELDILLKLQLLLGNRTVVISNSENSVPKNVLSLCKAGGIAENYISIMTVKQVKGLEFDTAFVFDEEMDKNEKYIAYTRALSELYVSSNVSGKRKKALGIKAEQLQRAKRTKNRKTDFPEMICDEDSTFDNHTPLYEDDNSPTSINELNERNEHKLLIVVRNTWSNDFCFVVERIDGQMARGKQYLNGNFHRTTAFNIYHKQFTMYTEPSRKKIEDQYE